MRDFLKILFEKNPKSEIRKRRSHFLQTHRYRNFYCIPRQNH